MQILTCSEDFWLKEPPEFSVMAKLHTAHLGAEETVVLSRLHRIAAVTQNRALDLPPSVFQPDPVLAAQALAAPSGHRARALAWIKRWVVTIPWLEKIARKLWARWRYSLFRNSSQQLTDRLSRLEQAVQRFTRENAEHRNQSAQTKAIVLALEQRIKADELRAAFGNDKKEDPLMQSSIFASWYAALEESARGEISAIAERQAAYLTALQAMLAGLGSRKVLDVGCGRGEWLGLLTEQGIECLGIDTNIEMLRVARAAGLHVAHAGLEEFLADSVDASLGAITAFQVVEHLDLAAFLALFHHAHRVLTPGGVLILETPNPENLQVGGFSFWNDPTHRRPIPPELLAQTAKHFGFTDIRIQRSSPWSNDLQLQDPSPAARHIEKLLFSAGQDYALIARKPLHAG